MAEQRPNGRAESSTTRSEPNFRQLLNHVVDEIAAQDPVAVYSELPRSRETLDDGFRKVTYAEFSNAINGMAWWLTKSLGPGRDFETLTYIGPNDLRHNILLLAAVKAGYKMLFLSPRYSLLGHTNLLKSTDCKTMLAPVPEPPITASILKAHVMRVHHIPEAEELLGEKHPHFPYEKSFEQARGEPLVVLHTSGTTGLPKPVIWTHDWAASVAEQLAKKPPAGYENVHRMMLGTRCFSLMPCYHASHMFGSILFSLFFRTVMLYPPSGVLPSVAQIPEVVKHTQVDCITLVPPYIEEIARNDEILDTMSGKIQSIMYAGGDVSLAAGSKISAKVNLFTKCGSTETGLWPTIRRSGPWQPDHWRFMNFHPATNMDMRERSDGIFEGVVRRNPAFDDEQPIFKLFPQLEEYPSGDLFSHHPLDPHLWQHYGRADDMQVFLSGEKYHPTVVERQIAQHPQVQEVLLVGTRRPRAALLLEMAAHTPMETSEQRAAAIELVWPAIETANQMSPTYAQVRKEHVLLTTLQKPMVRSGKGTVQRPTTVQLYEKELHETFMATSHMAIVAP